MSDEVPPLVADGATKKKKKKVKEKVPTTPEEIEADRVNREKLKAAVDKFDMKKWDEIARWMQNHKRFTNNMKQAPLHIPLANRKEYSSVRVYFHGKVLRKIIASSGFVDKFGLTFTRANSEILLVEMMNIAPKKNDFKSTLGGRYLVQTQAWQKEPLVKLKMPAQKDSQHILDDEPYAWVFQGNILWRHILLVLIVVVFLLACLFPVWPQVMKVGVWYLSVTFLLFLVVFLCLRGLIFLLMWVAGYDFWILPNILDDELPPLESFKPAYSLAKHSESRSGWIYRASLGIVLFAAAYWVYVQPNVWHAKLLDEQAQFVEDLYNGNFISDKAEADKQNLDEVVPAVETLEQELEAIQTEEELEAQKILDQILKEDEDLYAPDEEDGTEEGKEDDGAREGSD